MAAFTQIVEQASDILWNYLLLFLLVGTGIFFTIKLHFVQLSSFADGVRHLFKGFSLHGKAADKDGMSSFQALATAIAAQVGTGNITGCATALVSGGPGALFWTWVSAFFGMATIYAEAVLAQTYRTTVDGQVTGGPAYYIRAAFKGKFGKFLAIFFSVALILALGFMGNMVQSNSIGDAFHNAFGVNRVVVGVVIAVLAAFIFLGGVKRIAAVTEKLVPIMALFYIIGCVIILVMNASAIPNAFVQIFTLAFQPQAIAGGVAGVTVQQAMRYGVARGLFSNEAGLGSTPHAHALAKVKQPQDQGALAIIGVFVDRPGTDHLRPDSGRHDRHRPDPGRIQPDVWFLRQGVHCHLHAVLCVLHHFGLVLLRPGQLQRSVRLQVHQGVQPDCCAVHPDRFFPESGSGLGAGGLL